MKHENIRIPLQFSQAFLLNKYLTSNKVFGMFIYACRKRIEFKKTYRNEPFVDLDEWISSRKYDQVILPLSSNNAKKTNVHKNLGNGDVKY